jgi:hypothetical protein
MHKGRHKPTSRILFCQLKLGKINDLAAVITKTNERIKSKD